ncbi:chaoptin-like [Mizuhopecten yessoensis]|uniref:chaoptin-like n=1 Tax=Mizuhopecten yessoensis TaxID=6573 RepID=UPI000B45A4EC|nr:chaoptin-like [Mizuhopecten yessoensis]
MRNLDKNSFRDTLVKQLTLENIGLQHLSCDTFTNNRRELTILNLDDNLLDYFPACSLNNLNHLRELTLSKNLITCVPEHSIPGYLEHLDVSHNQIFTMSSDMSTDVYNENPLKTFNIRGNKLHRISNNELHQFTSLENLDVSENRLEYIHPRSFVSSGKHLRDINLSHNQLMTDVWFCLEHLQQVRNLNLSHNQIDHVNDNMLSSMTNLQTFDISYNMLSEVGPAFVNQQTMLVLLFHHNSITKVAEDMFAVGTRFMSSFTLDLSFNLLVSVDLTILDCWDCRFAIHHNKLTTMRLSSNQNSTFSLFDISSNVLLTIPPNLPPWTNFNGSNNPFSTASVMDVLTHFPNRTIYSVALQNTTFLCTNTDIPEIVIPSDITLNLADNCVPSQFLCHLRSNVSSQVNINLDRNGILTLHQCPLNVSVVKLSLKGNHLTYLNESFITQEMPNLKYLDLAENNMKSVNLSQLSKIVHLNASLNNVQELPFIEILYLYRQTRILDFSSSNISSVNNVNFEGYDIYGSYINVDISNNTLKHTFPVTFARQTRHFRYSTFYLNSSDNQIESITDVLDFQTTYGFYIYSSLLVFDLSRNKVKTVSNMIKDCTSRLRFSRPRIVINITKNMLTDFPSCDSQEQIECPDIILGLDFSYNFLHALPHSETCIMDKLVMLNVSHNDFTEIPEPIANSSNLLYLIMSGNKITTITPNAFIGLPLLRELDLSFNQLTIFPESIKSLSKLEKLNLAGNHILTIPDSGFSLWPSLSVVQLHGNPLVCSCSTAWLRNYTFTTDLGQCSYPAELEGTSVTCLEISPCDAGDMVYSSKENIQACFGNGLVFKNQNQTLQWNMSSKYVQTISQSLATVEVFRECKLVANFSVVDKDTWTLSDNVDEKRDLVCLTMSDKHWISNITVSRVGYNRSRAEPTHINRTKSSSTRVSNITQCLHWSDCCSLHTFGHCCGCRTCLLST